MHLTCPKTFDTRPITDRVKESLFSVLYGYDLPAAALVADLFAGVGSLGLESLSRGAAFATFVEQDPRIAASLNRNIEKAGVVKESKVIRANAFRIGAPTDREHPAYDVAFIDPPYARTKNVGPDSPLAQLMAVLSLQIRPDGLAVVRVEEHTAVPDCYGPFVLIDPRNWGSMTIAIYQNRTP